MLTEIINLSVSEVLAHLESFKTNPSKLLDKGFQVKENTI